MLHYTIKIRGKVQGVFFRASSKNMALELGLVGYVKNQPNGEVLIEVEGNEEQLNKLLLWCNKGSKNANVDHVTFEIGVLKGYTNFEILR